MLIFSRRNNIFSPLMISIPNPNSTIRYWPTPTILRPPCPIDMSGAFSISVPVDSGRGNPVIKNEISIRTVMQTSNIYVCLSSSRGREGDTPADIEMQYAVVLDQLSQRAMKLLSSS